VINRSYIRLDVSSPYRRVTKFKLRLQLQPVTRFWTIGFLTN